MDSYSIQPPEIDSFHSGLRLWYLCSCWMSPYCWARFQSYEYIIACLCSPSLEDMWVVSTCRWLWRDQLYLFVYRCLCELIIIFFSLEKILSSGIGELQVSYMINWIKTAKWFSRVAIPFCIPTSSEWEFLLLHILVDIWYCQCSRLWPFE